MSPSTIIIAFDHHAATTVAAVLLPDQRTPHFAYFLERLQSTPDGDGSLLDHTVILYGSSLSDGNLHWHNNLPILLIGGGTKGGRHLRYPDDTPMTNLLLTMLDMVKVPVERLGDSTGTLDLLSV